MRALHLVISVCGLILKKILNTAGLILLSRRPQPLSLSIKRPFKRQITFSLLLRFSTKMTEKSNRQTKIICTDTPHVSFLPAFPSLLKLQSKLSTLKLLRSLTKTTGRCGSVKYSIEHSTGSAKATGVILVTSVYFPVFHYCHGRALVS